jgi:predicted 2-oxoglutarate/Fe(II)-dependent dioxygenase YbiX
VLDFFGAFVTFAIKEGTSEIYHVDWNDDLDSITWLIPLGDWEGGELVLPQKGLERHISIWPGDVFGFMACTLVHCTTPVTKGRQVILTCFSDSNILCHGRFKLFFRSARLFDCLFYVNYHSPDAYPDTHGIRVLMCSPLSGL